MIQLTQVGNASVDVDLERYIKDGSDPVLSMQYERSAFKRVVDDVRLVLDDSDLFFTNLFRGQAATSVWYVRVKLDNKLLFVGKIKNETIRFDPMKEVCSFDVFSLLGLFWDRTKTTRVLNDPIFANESAQHYLTLEKILLREFVWVRGGRIGIRTGGGMRASNPYQDIFTGVSVHANFKNRLIRAFALASTYHVQGIGNNGRYGNLLGVVNRSQAVRRFGSRRTRETIEDVAEFTDHYTLLLAFATWYNAEFYVDYETNLLTMVPREFVINATPNNGSSYDLQTILRDDHTINIQLYDNEKYDYLHYVKGNAFVFPPTLIGIFDRSDTIGIKHNVSYVLTEVRAYADGGVYETSASVAMTVDVLSRIVGSVESVNITIGVPIFASGVVKKNIYRTSERIAIYYLIGTVTTHGLFVDPLLDQNVLEGGANPPRSSPTQLAWIRYNETTGKWDTPILDNQGGVNVPEGNIFETIPALRFNDSKDFNPDDLVAFFGRESGDANWENVFETQFLGELTTKHKISCTVDATGFKIGDAFFISQGLVPQFTKTGFYVKKASVHLNPKDSKTELELSGVA